MIYRCFNLLIMNENWKLLLPQNMCVCIGMCLIYFVNRWEIAHLPLCCIDYILEDAHKRWQSYVFCYRPSFGHGMSKHKQIDITL